MNISVLQDWLVRIPIRMQSNLILGLRGPDGFVVPNVKLWVRWMRGLSFRPGNTDNHHIFMATELPPVAIEKSPVAQELEILPQHFYSHLMHSVQVIAYRHPDPRIKFHAFAMYNAMCELMHLPHETRDDFEKRLCERFWPGGVQPDTAEEACAILEQHKS